MKYLSLFSGIGGFELGIKQAYENLSTQKTEERVGQEDAKALRVQASEPDNEGDKGLDGGGARLLQHSDGSSVRQPTCVGYSEIDKYAVQIYQKHFNHKNYGDITKLNTAELPDFDFLCGGFPCQAFSIAGKRKGFEDTRGTLFFEIARILRDKQPRLFLLENVKGLLSHDNGNTFRTIISTLDELGYDLQWQVLNSKNFGVPQNRERVFIVGHSRGTARPEVFPIGESDSGDVAQTDEGEQLLGSRQYTGAIDANYHKGADGKRTLLKKTERSYWHGWWKDDVKIRRLTPTECERLQGFPDGWTSVAGINEIGKHFVISDTQRYKCLGNAVTVNVIKAIAERLLN